jgi:hypothetical protein
VLTSLFGDLGPAGKDKRTEREPAFEATAIMESVDTAVNANGQMVDRHSSDLVVSGSPAQAIRDHFAATRSDLDTATSLITLVDPVSVWAPSVIKALSDASGRPVERLHLRDRTTLRTLATIERTTLARRGEEALRIYRADVRAPGSENAEIPVALMERSQLTAVIVGPLQPHAIDSLLGVLHAAAMLQTWRCPNLLFMLPPNAVWIANKIGAIAWPGRLHVHVRSESLTGVSSVWNALLGVWNHVKTQPGWEPSGHSGMSSLDDFPIKVAQIGAALPVGSPALSSASSAPRSSSGGLYRVDPPPATPVITAPVGHGPLDPAHAKAALGGLLALQGLIGCVLADITTGLVLAREVPNNADPIDLDLAAAASAQMLIAQRYAARSMGLLQPIDEVVTTAGPRQQLLRVLPRHPELFLMVLFDKHRTNLALARFQVRDLERALG